MPGGNRVIMSERRQKFQDLCVAAGELAKAANALGMSKYRLTLTPLDFNMLQRDALTFAEDDSMVNRADVHLASLPIEVKW